MTTVPVWEDIPEGDNDTQGYWKTVLPQLKERPGQWARVWGPRPLMDDKEHLRLSHYIRKHYDEFDATATTLKERDEDGRRMGVIHAVFMNDQQKKEKEERKSKYGKH